MKMDKIKKLSWLWVLLAGIMWGTTGIYIKRLNGVGLSTMEIVMIRSVLTAGLLLICILIYDRRLIKVKIRDVWCFFGTGVLSVVFFNYCYFRAMTIIPLSVAAILLYTAPAFVMVMSAFCFREQITVQKITIVFITISGAGLASGILNAHGQISLIGILYGVGAGIGYALYSIFGKFAINRGYNSLTISFYTFLFAAAASVLITGRMGFMHIGKTCTDDKMMLGFFVLFAVMSTVLPYILYTFGLSGMENGRASTIASIEPVTAAIISWGIYAEQLEAFQIMGIVFVLAAVVLSGKSEDKQ